MAAGLRVRAHALKKIVTLAEHDSNALPAQIYCSKSRCCFFRARTAFATLPLGVKRGFKSGPIVRTYSPPFVFILSQARPSPNLYWNLHRSSGLAHTPLRPHVWGHSNESQTTNRPGRSKVDIQILSRASSRSAWEGSHGVSPMLCTPKRLSGRLASRCVAIPGRPEVSTNCGSLKLARRSP